MRVFSSLVQISWVIHFLLTNEQKIHVRRSTEPYYATQYSIQGWIGLKKKAQMTCKEPLYLQAISVHFLLLFSVFSCDIKASGATVQKNGSYVALHSFSNSSSSECTFTSKSFRILVYVTNGVTKQKRL